MLGFWDILLKYFSAGGHAGQNSEVNISTKTGGLSSAKAKDAKQVKTITQEIKIFLIMH